MLTHTLLACVVVTMTSAQPMLLSDAPDVSAKTEVGVLVYPKDVFVMDCTPEVEGRRAALDLREGFLGNDCTFGVHGKTRCFPWRERCTSVGAINIKRRESKIIRNRPWAIHRAPLHYDVIGRGLAEILNIYHAVWGLPDFNPEWPDGKLRIKKHVSAELLFSRIFSHDNGVIGGLYGVQSGVQSALNEPYAQGRNPEASRTHDEHPKGPSRHILLCVQVVAGLGIFLGGFYGFGHTLSQSRSFSPGAGAKRVSLYAVIMLAGCYLIAAGVVP